MRLLCRMVIETGYDDLPPDVLDSAKRTILDTLAVTMGGSAMEGIDAFVSLVTDKGGKPESVIPFYGHKVPAAEAALAIGPMSRAMDFGDVHTMAGHCSEYILPVLLAAIGLKGKVSGKEFLSAFILGSEVLLRAGLFARPGASLSVGSSQGGNYIFGCVAAVGKLLGLHEEELLDAPGHSERDDSAAFPSDVQSDDVDHSWPSRFCLSGCNQRLHARAKRHRRSSQRRTVQSGRLCRFHTLGYRYQCCDGGPGQKVVYKEPPAEALSHCRICTDVCRWNDSANGRT